jgi:hypothetical protein
LKLQTGNATGAKCELKQTNFIKIQFFKPFSEQLEGNFYSLAGLKQSSSFNTSG